MAIIAHVDITKSGASAFGNSSGAGQAILDFGAFPGSNEASAVVTGLSGIKIDSGAFAFFQSIDTTADHSANDHAYAPAFIHLSCGSFVAGVGFTIQARSLEKMTGTFKVRFQWI